MAARITKSLDTLRSQVNALAPKRNKASDGWLGDAKHSMRKSDHNPEPDGTVDAFDLTHDPKNGVDIQRVCDAIIASRDRRVSYLICNGKIIAGKGGPKPWVKRDYTGPNKHTKHLHVSVLDAHQDDTAPWKINAAFGKAAPPVAKAPVPATKTPAKALAAPESNAGQSAITTPATVLEAQTRLKELGYSEVGTPDGKIGKMTTTAILAFRNEHDLPLTPVIDEQLLAELAQAKPREMVAARADATPAEVREQVPEVQGNFFSKIGAWILGIPAAIGSVISGAFEAIPGARETLAPIKEIAMDVPPWMWFVAVGGVALAIYLVARRGEKKGVEAFQEGARR